MRTFATSDPATLWHRTCSEAASANELGGLHSVSHGVLAGIDFFTLEVLTWRGLATYYVLFFLHLVTRRVTGTRAAPESLSIYMHRLLTPGGRHIKY